MLDKLPLDHPWSLLPQIGILAAGLLLGLALWLAWRRWVDARLAARPSSDLLALTLRASKRLTVPLVLALVALLGHAILGAGGRDSGLLSLVLPLLAALLAIRLSLFLLRVGAGTGRRLGPWEYLISSLIWLILVLYLLGWLPAVEQALDRVAFALGEMRISLLSGLKLLVTASVLILCSLWISRLLAARIQGRFDRDPALGQGLAKVVRFGLLALACLLAVTGAGIDLTSLAVVGGALGVGVGFGLQKVASNLVSGYLLLFDRSIRPGDVIQIGDSYGWVRKMAARYIVVRDRDGVDTLIPNEQFITTEVINWSYSDRDVRLKLPLQISYRDDPELAMTLMEQAAHASPRVIAEPPPACRLIGFGDNGIQLELRVWIADPENGVNNVRTDINLAIWRAFKEHGITIPYPQRDLHIQSHEPAPGQAGA